MELLQNFYETTLDALREAKNDRLWFKTNTKLGKLYFDREEWAKLQRILKQLHSSCQVGKKYLQSYGIRVFISAVTSRRITFRLID
jgi:hypothetical protein